MSKHPELVVVYGTVGAADGVKFGATLWSSTITDSGGGGAYSEGFGKKDTTLMEVKVFVGDVISMIAYNPAFDGVSCCAPFISGGRKYLKATWMWEVQRRSAAFGVKSLVVRRGGIVRSGGKKMRAVLSSLS